MKFPEMILERLKDNWGEKSNTLNCYAEVKLIDPLSSWCCYIFSMDESEEYVQCLLYSDAIGVEIEIVELSTLSNMYNEAGENPIIDTEYRRMRVTELLRRLKNDSRRH